jgi:4-amino-4-deoxy-L-arabinose transferase-like glycosyltransferase
MTFPSFKNYRYLLLITIVLGVLVLFWGLGSLQLMSLNEGRRALAIKEMFFSHNWLLPTLNGELYLSKPPFLYWFSESISILAKQVNEWTLRLPLALSGLSVGFIVYFYTKKHYGMWVALFAIQLLIANVDFAMLARRVEIEMLLTVFCFGALISAIQFVETQHKAWIYLSYVLLGISILTKGPVALLFVTFPLLVAAIYTKNQQLKEILSNKIGWSIFLIIALSWYVMISFKLGLDIWSVIIKRDMIDKMQGNEGVKPMLSYLGWIEIDSLLLVSLFLYKPKRLWLKYKNNIGFLILILSSVLPIIIFSTFNNKHAKYLLPIYPVISILLAIQIGVIFENAAKKVRYSILALGIFLPLIFAIFYIVIEPEYYYYRVSVFPKFQAWSKTTQVKHIYAFETLDTRLYYYAEKPIKLITLIDVINLKDNKQTALVLSEEKHHDIVAKHADCELKVFEPYLKDKKKFYVYGFGSVCKN